MLFCSKTNCFTKWVNMVLKETRVRRLGLNALSRRPTVLPQCPSACPGNPRWPGPWFVTRQACPVGDRSNPRDRFSEHLLHKYLVGLSEERPGFGIRNNEICGGGALGGGLVSRFPTFLIFGIFYRVCVGGGGAPKPGAPVSSPCLPLLGRETVR